MIRKIHRKHIFAGFQCARDGDVQNMERLLNQMTGNIRRKINKADDEFLSPLHYAARCNHIEIVRMLVEKGAGWYRPPQDVAFLCAVSQYTDSLICQS